MRRHLSGPAILAADVIDLGDGTYRFEYGKRLASSLSLLASFF